MKDQDTGWLLHKQDLELYRATISNEIHLSRTGISNAFGILSVVEKSLY